MSPDDVQAVVVTRGGYDISEVLESLIFDDVLVWDNSKLPNLRCWGRYAATLLTDKRYIYFQDDDCIVDPLTQAAICVAHEHEGDDVIVANMDPPWGHGHPLWLLPSGGLLTHRDLPARAFAKWLAAGHDLDSLIHPSDTDTLPPSPDMVFAVLTPGIRLDFGKRDLPRSGQNFVLHRQEGFMDSRNAIYAEASRIRGEDDYTVSLKKHVYRLWEEHR